MDDEEKLELANSEINLPDFLKVPIDKYYRFEDIVKDYSDFEELGNAINECRMSMFRITEYLNKAERAAKLASIEYDRKYRREFISSNGKTESERRMRAALICEDLENKKFAADQYREELTRMSFVIKSELSALQMIANNFRSEIRG